MVPIKWNQCGYSVSYRASANRQLDQLELCLQAEGFAGSVEKKRIRFDR
jgi:hypothetical protein